MAAAGKETFTVQVRHMENATWQGTVAWAEGCRQETFRSALELIRLIDSALNQDDKE